MENNNTNNGAQNANTAQMPPQPPQGYDQSQYGYNHQYYPPPPPRRKHSDKPKIAGGLLLVVGILGLIMGSFMVAGGIYVESGGTFDMGSGQIDITGMVLAADGTPIDNATLTIAGTHITVLTDSTGHYQMLGVPTGYQLLTVEKSGFNTLEHHVLIINADSGTNEVFEDMMVISEDSELNFNLTTGSDTYVYGEEGKMFAEEGMGPLILAFGVVFILCSIGAMVGGAYALKREKYPVVIVGAILGIFSVGFGLGIVLAIVALIILILASDEFRSKGNGNQYPPR